MFKIRHLAFILLLGCESTAIVIESGVPDAGIDTGTEVNDVDVNNVDGPDPDASNVDTGNPDTATEVGADWQCRLDTTGRVCTCVGPDETISSELSQALVVKCDDLRADAGQP